MSVHDLLQWIAFVVSFSRFLSSVNNNNTYTNFILAPFIPALSGKTAYGIYKIMLTNQ